ncbi:MAG: cysteine synthase A [Ruminococcaceae bacterium]|nr:cysteine synthase A [Oscillospiraceae bacterium]
MKKIYENIEELIGNTPLLHLKNTESSEGFVAKIYAKLEYLNPAGSVKDRVARAMLDDAEKRGLITPGATIIEPTSGNTGIGLAMLCAARGYKAIIVMPSNMSRERILLMRSYGAEVVLTDASLGMSGAIARAQEIAGETSGSFIPSQFSNPANPEAHRLTTGPEIYDSLDGEVDVFVAGVGTGGTITGVGEYLKSKKPSVKVIAVEPRDSAVLSGGKAGPHGLAGIGAGFVPEVLNTEIYDEIITVSTEEAYASVRSLSELDGVRVGISSGAAMHAAKIIAMREEFRGKNIVVLFPDTQDRYLSTPLFD